MHERGANELEFIQITSGSNTAGGHTLYGLTRDGRIYEFQRGLARWKAMPMMHPVEADFSVGR